MARSYESAGNLQMAINNYRQLSGLVPYKFIPRDNLVNLLLQKGDTANAIKQARFIINMPVKKESAVIKEIKQNMKILIKNINKDEYSLY